MATEEAIRREWAPRQRHNERDKSKNTSFSEMQCSWQSVLANDKAIAVIQSGSNSTQAHCIAKYFDCSQALDNVRAQQQQMQKKD